MSASESRTFGVMMPGARPESGGTAAIRTRPPTTGQRQDGADEAETEDEADPVLDVVDAQDARHERERDGRGEEDGVRPA